MKKFFYVALAIVLTLLCCSCQNKTTFVEGNLLYDLGAKSFEDIEKIEFLHEEYQGAPEDKIEITDKEDIELFSDYTYSSEYPGDKLHELFVYPTNSVYVTVRGVGYQLCLGDDGSLTTVSGNNMPKSLTYKAANGKGITDEIWEKLISKYD